VGIAAAHNVDPDGRFALDSVIDALKPMVEPSGPKRIEIEGRVRRELRLSGETAGLTTVRPWSDNETLKALLCLSST
jgi:hypothetical protein